MKLFLAIARSEGTLPVYMKKYGKFVILVGLICCVSASSCAFPFFWKKKDAEAEHVRREDLPTGDATYLDTLNQNKEVALAKTDFSEAGLSAPSPSENTAKRQVDGFRVQCFASSSIDAVREKKKEVESKTGLAAYIAYAEPYYKLHLGDFTSREKAEQGLQKIKRAGYADAWIVRSKIMTPQ